MATMKRPRLAAVKALSGHRLRLTFVDGSIYTVSLAGEFDKFPALAPLRNPKAFAKAVDRRGRGLDGGMAGARHPDRSGHALAGRTRRRTRPTRIRACLRNGVLVMGCR